MNKALLIVGAALVAATVFPVAPALAGGPPLPPCTCRLFGESVPLGTRMCMRTPAGARIAICGLDQNVTSWKASGSPCEEASRPAGGVPGKG